MNEHSHHSSSIHAVVDAASSTELFSEAGFMPHGHCYLWKPALVWTHVVSDLLIGLAYVAISISLFLIIRRIRLQFSSMVLAFGLFIGACGATHFMEIWNLWNPDYWAAAFVKIVTAIASVATSVWLVRIRPQILAVAEAAKLAEKRRLDLESLTRDLEFRVVERTSELKKTQALLQRVLDQTEAAIYVKDLDSRWILANKRLFTLLGRKEAEVIGKTDYELLPPEIARQYVENDLRVLNARTPVTFEENLVVDGDVHTFISNKFPLIDDSDTPYAVCGISTDITDRKKAEESLRAAMEKAEEASRAKSQFLANMSHEIRTPLGAMLGFTELALETQSASDLRDSLLTILRNGQQLYRVIDDILDLSKVEASKLEIQKTEFDLDEVLGDITSLLSFKAQEKGLLFEVTSRGPLPDKIETDPIRFRQILINVIGNAIKFTDNGRINVELHLKELGKSACLEIRVSDTGVGIPSDSQSKLFQPFSQADLTNARRFGGTGLGLYLSKQLAIALGGDLRLERSKENEGSTFTIFIDIGPLKSRPLVNTDRSIKSDTQVALPKPKFDGLEDMSLLVVDDSPDNLQLTYRYLMAAKASKVECAKSAADMFHLLRNNHFDVILMDIQMPVMDGYAAVRKLRAEGYKKPVAALTAHAMSGEKEKCLEAGFDQYLIKPINRTKLVEVVRELVRTSRNT